MRIRLMLPAPVLAVACATTPPPIEITELHVHGMVFDARAAGPEDGELVFLLHGFPQTSYSFRHQIVAVAGAGYRAIAPDQRGYSPGARPEFIRDYKVTDLVEDVIGMADALGRDTFHVVGHDWGAAVAWFTALYHPERVLSVVAVSVPHPLAFFEVLADPEGDQAQRSSYMEMLRSEDAEQLFLADDAAMLRAVYEDAGLEASAIEVYLDVLGNEPALHGALNWYRAMGIPQFPRRMTPIRMPTMYVWSTEDHALGREGAEATVKYVEGPYRFEVLEGVSHWVPEEAAERLSELLLEHLDGLER